MVNASSIGSVGLAARVYRNAVTRAAFMNELTKVKVDELGITQGSHIICGQPILIWFRCFQAVNEIPDVRSPPREFIREDRKVR